MNIYLCPSPELYPLYHRPGAIVIIVDIFRASTTMVTALAHGARSILPVATTEEAEEQGKALGCLIAAERNVVKCPFAQLGNDPAEYTEALVSGQDIVFTTTNGTRALNIAAEHGAEEILVGAFINLSATLRYCHTQGKDVLILAAGWKGQLALEDTLYAGAFAFLAEQATIGKASDDGTLILRDLWQAKAQSLEDRITYIQHSEHYARLVQAGFSSAVPLCMTLDTTSIIARMQGARLLPIDCQP